jgi:hypothetical protein
MREQHLRDPQIMPAKKRLIKAHQTRLTNRGASLYRGQIGWPLMNPELHHSSRYRPATHQNTLVAGRGQFCDFGRQSPDLRHMESVSGRLCQDAASELYDDPLPFICHQRVK